MKKSTPRRPLRTAADVQSLSTQPHFPIGTGKDGHVFAGRIRFAGRKRQRVAVKKFHTPLNDVQAARYQKIIQRLYDAGVSIPKMGMIKTPAGEWVLVTQLYGSTEKGSRLGGIFFKHPHAKRDAIIQATRITNAGFSPVEDIIEPFHDQRKGAIPIDIHSLFERPLREDIRYRVEKLMEYIHFVEPDPRRQPRYVRMAIQNATPAVKRAIQRHLLSPGGRP